MSKPVPPKEQDRLTTARSGSGQAAPTKAPASGGSSQRTEARPTAPQVSRPKVIEPPTIPHEQIAFRAYQIWVELGRPDGKDRETWFEAEHQLRRSLASGGMRK